jgi:hypothetical protein
MRQRGEIRDPLGRIQGSACIEGVEPPGAAQLGRFRLGREPLEELEP